MSVFHQSRRRVSVVACIVGLSVGATLLVGSTSANAAPATSTTSTTSSTKHVAPQADFTMTSPIAGSMNTVPAGSRPGFPNAELPVTGTGTDGDTVRLLRHNGMEAGRGVVANGAYAFSADVQWGTWQFTIERRPAGSSSWTKEQVFTATIARTGSLPFTVSSPTEGDRVDLARVGTTDFPNTRVRFTGTGAVGDRIWVERAHNHKRAGSTTVGAEGKWAIDADYNFGEWGADVFVNGELTDAIASITIAESQDTTTPTTPADLMLMRNGQKTVHVMWDHATDDTAVDHYEIERNGAFLRDVAADVHMVDIDSHEPGETYEYRVRAVDAAGNRSDWSARESITMPRGDSEAPTAPKNLRSADVTADSLTVNWTASTDNVGVDHYVAALTKDGKPAGSKTVGNPSAIFTGLDADTTYVATVTAVDEAGNASQPARLEVTTAEQSGIDPSRGVPKNLTASAGTYPDGDLTLNRVVLDWTPDAEAARRYEIWIDGKRWQTLLVVNEGDPLASPTDVQHRYLAFGSESPVGHTVKMRAQLDGGSWSAFTPELTVK